MEIEEEITTIYELVSVHFDTLQYIAAILTVFLIITVCHYCYRLFNIFFK